MSEQLADLGRKRSLRERAAARRRMRKILIGLGAAALAGLLVWLLFFSGVFAVRSTQVSGTHYCTDQQVLEAAAVAQGGSLILINKAAIEQRVLELPCVEEVEISRSWPGTVKLRVSEVTPIFQRQDPLGYQLVSADGTVFALQSESAALPMATTPDTDQKLLRDLAEVVQAIPSPVAAMLSQVSATTRDRIVLKLSDGREIIWGGAQDSELKAQVIIPLLNQPGTSYDISAPANPAIR